MNVDPDSELRLDLAHGFDDSLVAGQHRDRHADHGVQGVGVAQHLQRQVDRETSTLRRSGWMPPWTFMA
jgi:hypothetical protein